MPSVSGTDSKLGRRTTAPDMRHFLERFFTSGDVDLRPFQPKIIGTLVTPTLGKVTDFGFFRVTEHLTSLLHGNYCQLRLTNV